MPITNKVSAAWFSTPAASLPRDGRHGQRQNELPIKKHQALSLELFENLLDTFRRQAQIQRSTYRRGCSRPVNTGKIQVGKRVLECVSSFLSLLPLIVDLDKTRCGPISMSAGWRLARRQPNHRLPGAMAYTFYIPAIPPSSS